MAVILARNFRGICTSCVRFEWPKEKPTVFPDTYNSYNVQSDWYNWWEKNDCFKPKSESHSDNKFCIVLPPPNVTGTLHLGHALTVVLQDVLSRWHRMKGSDVLWVPGTDHAGIATQVAVEKHLMKKKNLRRLDVGREEFLKLVWSWKSEKDDTIKKQLRMLGASLDWSRDTFTMDKNYSRAVNEAVIKLWNAGLFYRKEALVNWSCYLQSTISDIEVEHRLINGPQNLNIPGYSSPVKFGLIDDFAYKVVNSDKEIVVSTTRIETMLGDVAVAVNPNDERYKELHGARLRHPLRNSDIPVICDEAVDINFGTGAVKVTSSHDHNDHNLALRHSLPFISVINDQGLIHNFPNSSYSGMKRFEAREAIREDLRKQGLYRDQRPHQYQLPICSRSGDVIEHLLKPQWFINCKDMAAKALEAVKTGQLVIQPSSFERVWMHWFENIEDWCVSRQLWWGHRLPIYQASTAEGVKGGGESGPVWVAAHSIEEATAQAAAILQVGGADVAVRQDADVLDTWFSSGIFPLAAFGWPQKTEDFSKFYPLSLMVTGHDILFFWVARMTMLGQQLTGQLPFKKILLHGIICDNEGRKMSKSLGNVIYPENIIKGVTLEDLHKEVEKNYKCGLISGEEMKKAINGQKATFPPNVPDCGTDALRFTLMAQNIHRHAIDVDIQDFVNNRSFCNKIWHAFRYTLNKISDLNIDVQDASVLPYELNSLSLIDQWILSRLSEAVDKMNQGIENADLHITTSAFRRFFHSFLCDVYLEATKPVFRKSDDKEISKAISTLMFCLDTSLKLLAPIMPFLCEEINYQLPGKRPTTLMYAQYPSNYQFRNAHLEEEVEFTMDVIRTIRRMKKTNGVKKVAAHVEIESQQGDILTRHYQLINSFINDDYIITDLVEHKNEENFVCEPVSFHTHVYLKIPTFEISEDEIERLLNQEKKLNKALVKLLETVENETFKEKAPLDVQDSHRKKILGLQEKLLQIRRKLDSQLLHQNVEP
ncbi:valine--tRNA ligase [Nilaparvata lugens]|uniref:valine--tRNA ligase n=1 Tax=Nilaparvata lugens TaxID=108931 RepID=UPI00193E4241|nr:valine--tRNA ligase [Nilaparvata lugens]